MNETLFILWLIGFAGEPKPAEPVEFIVLFLVLTLSGFAAAVIWSTGAK